jgi:hypothetical protein
MSRTNHPHKRNYNTHPYWKFRWWIKHGPADLRRFHNRIERSREKQAIRQGLDEHGDLLQDPPRRRKYIAWIYW